MDFSNFDFTSFAGIAAGVWGLLEALKTRFKWVDGHEEALAVALPMAAAVGMKLTHFGFVAGMGWWQILSGALAAGLASQVLHDKVGPGVTSAWGFLKSLVTGK